MDRARPIASDELLQDWRSRALRMEEEVGKAIIGQPGTLRLISVALFARGHVLLEGDVGIGKTTILRAFSRAVGGSFERVEGTVDLMPADLVYHTYVDADGKPVLDAQWSQAVSRNPFLGVRIKGAKAGDKISVTWVDNKGDKRTDEATVAAGS